MSIDKRSSSKTTRPLSKGKDKWSSEEVDNFWRMCSCKFNPKGKDEHLPKNTELCNSEYTTNSVKVREHVWRCQTQHNHKESWIKAGSRYHHVQTE